MSDEDKLSKFMLQEVFDTFCGNEPLGKGTARTVHPHATDITLVVKLETIGRNFQNIIEWETWQRVKDTDLAKWFAPCYAISPNGAVLVQHRTVPAAIHPTHIPAFFTDLKLGNFGVLVDKDATESSERPYIKNKFVCHDYGTHLMLEKGMTKRMRRANWWI